MTEPLETVVPHALAGQRVDRAVSLLTGCARSEASALIDAGAVAIGGRTVVRGADRLVENSLLVIDTAGLDAASSIEGDPGVDLDVIFEDDHVLVIDKPAGLVVHPGAGSETRTLVHGLVALDPAIALVGDPTRPGIVHRLDKGTSGLLAVARSQAAYEGLVEALAAREVERRYLAVAWGHFAHDRGVIDAPLGRSRRDRTRQAVVADGREARTSYEVQRRVAEPAAVTIVTCRLETGRTHQIRVHLDAIGHPVVGDERYGGVRSGITFGRPALHAASLGFAHPITGEWLSFESPTPPDLAELLALLM